MADFAVKRFNWVRTPSLWRQSEAWRARQQEMRESFEAANSAANSSFFTANLNLVTGLGSVAAQTASKRIQAQALAAYFNKLA